MNRSLQIRGALVIVILLLSIWGLIPTFRAATISKAEREQALDDPALKQKHDAIDAKAIRQGLDLQGGMYIVLEVDQEGMSPDQARDALSRVREIITNRVDQFGVSEPIIQVQGSGRIIVQLPGIQDPDRVRGLIGQTAQLEFKMVRPIEEYEPVLRKLDTAFRKGAEASDAEADSAATETSAAAAGAEKDTMAAETAADAEVDREVEGKGQDDAALGEDKLAAADSDTVAEPFSDLIPAIPSTGDVDAEDPYVQEHPFTAYVYYDAQFSRSYGTPVFVEATNLLKVQRMLNSSEARVIPRDTEFQFDMEPVTLQGGLKVYPLYLLDAEASLTGDRLTAARATPDRDRLGSFQVNMQLDRKGARIFSKLSGENIGRHLAISLDGRVASAPVFQTKIPSGDAVITGNFTNTEASDLALLLRAGALPTDVRIEEERTVGPSLGRDSIRKGVRAAIYGSLLVVFFMLLYYGRSGFVVVLALVSNIIILLAVLAQFGLVLTLPGIAGIILTVGMAVDANVLINERIREELRKDKTVRAAVDSGYANATRTIVDANVTTLIAGVILLWFGTGPIKGFAVTLSIGILTSMFTALVQSRVIMELVTRGQVLKRVKV